MTNLYLRSTPIFNARQRTQGQPLRLPSAPEDGQPQGWATARVGNRKGCPYGVFHGQVRFPVSGVIPRVIIRSPLQGVGPQGGCLGQPITVYRLPFTFFVLIPTNIPNIFIIFAVISQIVTYDFENRLPGTIKALHQ